MITLTSLVRTRKHKKKKGKVFLEEKQYNTYMGFLKASGLKKSSDASRKEWIVKEIPELFFTRDQSGIARAFKEETKKRKGILIHQPSKDNTITFLEVDKKDLPAFLTDSDSLMRELGTEIARQIKDEEV